VVTAAALALLAVAPDSAAARGLGAAVPAAWSAPGGLPPGVPAHAASASADGASNAVDVDAGRALTFNGAEFPRDCVVGSFAAGTCPGQEILADPDVVGDTGLLAPGRDHGCFVFPQTDADARVKCWGINLYGQLGLGDTQDRGDGPGEMGVDLPDLDLGVAEVLSAGSGEAHTCVLAKGGGRQGVKCWGLNDYGQLGYGDKDNRGDDPEEMGSNLPFVDLGPSPDGEDDHAPVWALAVGARHTCALLANADRTGSEVKCWGFNTEPPTLIGTLGIVSTADAVGVASGDMGASLPSVNLGSNFRPTNLTAGADHTCAVGADVDGGGKLKCWGLNNFEQLGYNDALNRGGTAVTMGEALPILDFGRLEAATSVAAGVYQTCAVHNTEKLRCWGKDMNDLTQPSGITTPATAVFPDPQIENAPGFQGAGGPSRPGGVVAAGVNHTCAATIGSQDPTLDGVRCWGKNESGQLGYGDTKNRGSDREEVGKGLPAIELGYTEVNNLGVPTNLPGIRELAAGESHTCALFESPEEYAGRIKCWGRGGRLGYGDTLDRGASRSNGENNTMGVYVPEDTTADPPVPARGLPFVDLGTEVFNGATIPWRANRIVAGADFTCALGGTQQTVKCWGENADGQLGYGDTRARGDEEGEMGTVLPTVDVRATFDASDSTSIIDITAGRAHVCALRNGIDPEQQRLDANPPGSDLDPWLWYSVADPEENIRARGVVVCWGNNSFGQLGNEPENPRSPAPAGNVGSSSNQMGPYLVPAGLGKLIDAAGGIIETQYAALPVTSVHSSPGADHTCVISDEFDNKGVNWVKCWGRNDYGQLGLGDTINRGLGGDELNGGSSDISGVAILPPGQRMNNNLPAVDLEALRVDNVVVGADHSCAIFSTLAATSAATAVTDAARMRCWGRNDAGQLGIGDAVNRGDRHSRPEDPINPDVPDAYYNWMGSNLPNIAIAYEGSAGTFPAFSVGGAAGAGWSCAVLRAAVPYIDGVATGPIRQGMKCWGLNEVGVGQLGLGDAFNRGDGPLEMGDSLPETAFTLFSTPVFQLTGGSEFFCALERSNGASVKCFGTNSSFGELGAGSITQRPLPVDAQSTQILDPAFVIVDDDLLCSTIAKTVNGITTVDRNVCVNGPPALLGLPAGVDITTVASGFFHTCVTTISDDDVLDSELTQADGRGVGVKCWGRNVGFSALGDQEDAGGYLGYGDLLNRGGDLSTVGLNLPFVALGNINVGSRKGTDFGLVFGIVGGVVGAALIGVIVYLSIPKDAGDDAPQERTQKLDKIGQRLQELRQKREDEYAAEEASGWGRDEQDIEGFESDGSGGGRGPSAIEVDERDPAHHA